MIIAANHSLTPDSPFRHSLLETSSNKYSLNAFKNHSIGIIQSLFALISGRPKFQEFREGGRGCPAALTRAEQHPAKRILA